MDTKVKVKDTILMGMEMHLTGDLMGVLEGVIREAFQNITMEELTTLPAVTQEMVDKENARLIEFYFWKKKNLTEQTKQSYMGTLKRFCLAVRKPLQSVSEMDAEIYLDNYMHRRITTAGKVKVNSPTTMNNERRNLYSFFTWMRQMRLRQDNPMENIEKYKEIRKPIDYYSREQLIALRDACRENRERAIIEVFHSTGGRVGEITEIRRDDVDWTTGDIVIMSEKSRKYRTIWLDEDARYYLKKYLAERSDSSPYLFVSERAPHNKLSRGCIRQIMKKIKERAGLTCRVYPHKMRKTLGMEMKNAGYDIGIIQEVMGHANPGVTAQYYAQSTAETLREIRKKMVA